MNPALWLLNKLGIQWGVTHGEGSEEATTQDYLCIGPPLCQPRSFLRGPWSHRAVCQDSNERMRIARKGG